MFRFAFLTSVLVFLVGCASGVRESISYSPDDEKSLVVLEERYGMRGSGSSGFKEVDLDTEQFLPGAFSITHGVMSRLEADGDDSRPYFSVGRARPGNYALVMLYSADGYGSAIQCFSLGTHVYEIVPGKINIIARSMDPYKYEDGEYVVDEEKQAELLETIRAKLSHYENIKGDLVVSKPVAAIAFEGKQQILGSGCPKGNTFKTIDPANMQFGGKMQELIEMLKALQANQEAQ